MRHRETISGGFTESNKLFLATRPSAECSNPWDTYAFVETFTGTEVVKTIDDVETPGFMSLRKCGKFLPLNTVDIKEVVRTQQAGSGTQWERKSDNMCDINRTTGSYYLEITPWTVALPPADSTLITQVGNAAIADAKAGVMDALTALAEAKQTASLLANLFRTFNQDILVPARRARRLAKNPRQAFDIFNRIWLQTRYGIRPLIYDIDDTVKAFQTHLNKSDLIRGRSKVSERLDEFNTYIIPQSGASSQKVVTERISGTRTYRGKAYAEVVQERSMRFQFDSLVTAYEIIPYSFVFDMFCDVGSFIQAVTPFSGANMLGAMVSIKDVYTSSQTVDFSWPEEPYRGSYSRASTKLQVEHYSRQSYSASLPGFNPRLSPAKVIDLIALLFQGRSNLHKQLR